MGMVCGLCGSPKFRLSSLRRADLFRLFQLRYPVRCRECAERGYTYFWDALKTGRADRIRRRQRHAGDFHPR